MDTVRWPIQKLTGELIAKIAAGEVVERPASAIKELVENAIDAGATAVTVEIKEGGIAYFRVSDNGHGIEPSQIKMAFERNATSKLVKESELYEIATLGFRGEALASIAAVSRITCLTRTKDAQAGIKAQVEAGEFVQITEAASPIGTSITVKDLFFNTPVRLKFLKKPAYEAAIVSDYMMRLILSRPDIAFRFVGEGKTVYQSAGDGNVESAIYATLGRDTLRQMRKVEGHQGGVVLSGYLGVGELARGNRQSQSFFINGRFFRSPLLSKAVERACEGSVMVGKYPVCVLYLQMPYDQVDVNVHPNKLEVRFQRTDAVLDAVEIVLRESLNSRTVMQAMLPKAQRETVAPVEQQRVRVESANEAFAADTPVAEAPAPKAADKAIAEAVSQLTPVRTYSGIYSKAQLKESTLPYNFPQMAAQGGSEPVSTPHVQAAKESVLAEKPQPSAPTEQIAFAQEQQALPLTYIGALFKTYLVFESGDRALLVDQHAAHERILFERYMASMGSTRLSQQLLSPRLVTVSPEDLAALMVYKDALFEAGLEFDPFDERSIAVRAVPSVLGASFPLDELMTGAIDAAREQRGQITLERIRTAIAQMACKHAIKAGDTLPPEQARALVQTMLESGTAPQCPHGRPIVVEMTQKELEKRFKRIQ